MLWLGLTGVVSRTAIADDEPFTGAASASDAVIGGSTRVIGGGLSSDAQWPSVVALVREGASSPADRQFCGATVIAPYWLLTAAHCLYDGFDRELEPSNIRAVAGVNDLRAETVREEIVVTNLFVHPEYDHVSQNAYDDIALLEVATAFDAPTVTLFTGDVETLGTAAAVIVGWGATEFTNPSRAVYPDALHHAAVPLVPRSVCNEPNSYDGYVDADQLCAGYPEGGIDSCIGDSGGPLFIDAGRGIEQVGVVSYGRGCAEPRFYGIYTSVTAYRAWIEQFVELEQIAPAPPPERPRGTTGGGASGGEPEPETSEELGSGSSEGGETPASPESDGGGGGGSAWLLALLGFARLLEGRRRRGRG